MIRFWVTRARGHLHVACTCGDDEVVAELATTDNTDGRREARAWVKALEPDGTMHRREVLIALRGAARRIRRLA